MVTRHCLLRICFTFPLTLDAWVRHRTLQPKVSWPSRAMPFWCKIRVGASPAVGSLCLCNMHLASSGPDRRLTSRCAKYCNLPNCHTHTHLVILVDMAMSSQQNKLGSRHRDKLHRTVQAADFQMCTLTVTQPMIFSPKKTKAAQISWTTGTYKV